MSGMRCPRCGRWARYDATRGAWWCDFDERALKRPPQLVGKVGGEDDRIRIALQRMIEPAHVVSDRVAADVSRAYGLTEPEAQDTAASSGLRDGEQWRHRPAGILHWQRVEQGEPTECITCPDEPWPCQAERVRAALAHSTPESSLRDALAAALHATCGGNRHWTDRDEPSDIEVRRADAIIAALPGLSLSAPEKEPE